MKIKILQIHDYPPLEGGGIEINVSRISKHLIESGYDVTLATGRFSSETFMEQSKNRSYVTDYGLKVELLDTHEKLNELIANTDIVHIHFTFSCRPASMIAMDYCVRTKKPCVVSIRTSLGHIPFSALSKITSLERDSKLNQVKEAFKADNVYISAPSEHIREVLEYLGINKELTVIRNGIASNISRNKVTPSAVEEVSVTYLGEISFLKGVNYLVDAIKILKQTFPNFKARFIGGGSDLEQIRQLIWYFGLEDTILLAGYINNDDVPMYLKASKLYVHPSLTESWGNAIAEALVLGVPVVATAVGGVPEMVKHGEYASLVPQADASALAFEIQRLLSNPLAYEIAKNKTLRAKDYFKKTYTFIKQAKQLDNFYKKIYEQQIGSIL